MTKAKWKKFEELVAKVQSDLAPNNAVLVDQKILGKITKRKRQIDILVRERIGHYEVLIAIECKDFKRPLNVKSIEAAKGLFEDVGAHIKVIVSASGFTKAAMRVGEHADIRLYKLIDTGEHDWKTEIALPSICHVKNLGPFQFVINYLGTGPIPASHSFLLHDNNHNELGEASDLLLNWWEENHENVPAGERQPVNFINTNVLVSSNGMFFPVNISALITVETFIFYRNWPIAAMSGFEDQIEKGIETRGFTLSNFNIDELKNNWIKISSETQAPNKPIITLGIVTCAHL